MRNISTTITEGRGRTKPNTKTPPKVQPNNSQSVL